MHFSFEVVAFRSDDTTLQGFPFESFDGGARSSPLGKVCGGGYTPIFGGGKHNFTNLMGKNA